MAVAAGFAPLALGTETQGSISCPASHAALYGFKPSTGLISRNGVLPSSTSFDTPGFLAKSTWDLASIITVAAGPDPHDPITMQIPPHVSRDYAGQLLSTWPDWRIGVLDQKWFWSVIGVVDDVTEEEKVGSKPVLCSRSN